MVNEWWRHNGYDITDDDVILYTILHNFEERFGNEPDKKRGGCNPPSEYDINIYDSFQWHHLVTQMSHKYDSNEEEKKDWTIGRNCIISSY